MLMLDVFPAQMDRLMLIFANPLRSTRGATLLCSSAFELTVEETVKQDGDINMQIVNHDTQTH